MLGRPSKVDKYLKDAKKIVKNKKINFPVGVPLKMVIFTNFRFETIKRAQYFPRKSKTKIDGKQGRQWGLTPGVKKTEILYNSSQI